MARLSISLIGPFRVTLDGEPITDFATVKAQALLAYVSVEAARAHRRDAVAGLLWPEQPRQKARQSLRQALYRLRRAVHATDRARDVLRENEANAPFLLLTRQTIQFNPESDHWLDVTALTSLVKKCRLHRHRRLETCLPCLRRMTQIGALYQGEFLEEFVVDDSNLFEEWVVLKRESLHRQTMEALIYLSAYHERRGDLADARRYARRQVEMEPWREEAHRQLMRILALEGQRSAALAQYEACRDALARELRVTPTRETIALYERIRAGETAGILDGSRVPLHSVPPAPTPFVGREKDLEGLADMLSDPDCRLVTIVGPGGVGKSRLALQAAMDQRGNFADGIVFVSLTPVSSPELLPSALAETLEISFHEHQDSEQQILDYLRDKELLLVLDGMEHVLEGAAMVAKLVHRGPGLIILVTSRERLNLREERVVAIEGLDYPGEGESLSSRSRADEGVRPLDLTRSYSAIELFLQQAQRADHHLSLWAEGAPYIIRICQLVEGLPLGLELAAAWTGLYACREIAQEIERNLDILSTDLRNVPDRQRSLRATFEHSWQLLSQEEKDLLAQLSVFRGGFGRDAALQVTGAAYSTLLALVQKSLIRRVGWNRYDMHGLLAQYAAEKLSSTTQEREEMEVRFALHFGGFLERQRAELRRAKGREAFRPLLEDLENVRRAWHLAAAHDQVEPIKQGSESLYIFYDIQGRFQEGIHLFEHVTDRWAGDPRKACVVGKLISRQGALHLRQGRYNEAIGALGQGLMIARHQKMRKEEIFCLIHLADAARKRGCYAQSERLSRRALALSQENQHRWGITQSLLSLGLTHYRTGEIELAERFLEKSLAMGRETGNPRLIVAPLNVLGDIVCHRGDYAKGLALFSECLSLSRELGHDFRVALILNNLGTVSHVLGRFDEARTAYQGSLEICRRIGDRRGQAIALSNLGELASADGAYNNAEKLYRQGLALGRDMQDNRIILACLNNLGEAAANLGEYGRANLLFAEALTLAKETRALPMLLKVLVNLAAVFAQTGQRPRAAELLALAVGHKASEQATQDKCRRLLDDRDLDLPDTNDKCVESVITELVAQLTQEG